MEDTVKEKMERMMIIYEKKLTEQKEKWVKEEGGIRQRFEVRLREETTRSDEMKEEIGRMKKLEIDLKKSLAMELRR